MASGSEDGLDDLAVLRVDDLPHVPLLQLSATVETGSPITVAGFRRFAQSFLIRQIRGRLGQQIGLEARERPGRVVAWDLMIEDEYGLEPGHSGAPVVDARSGHVLAVASHRLGGAKGVAMAVETLDNVWSGMLSEVQASYPANAFGRELGLFGRGVPGTVFVDRVDPAVLQRFRVSSRVGFFAAATDDVAIHGGFRALSAVRADGLSEEEIGQLVNNWYACVKEVGTARAGTDRQKHGHLFFLFDSGCSEEMANLIGEVGAVPKPGKSFKIPLPPPPEILISSYVVDFKNGRIHAAPATIFGPGEFRKEYLERLLIGSTWRFFPH